MLEPALAVFWILWTLMHSQTTFLPDARVGAAWMDCPGGKPVVHIAADAAPASWNHELVHAADCLDDGTMNGSYGPVDPLTRSPYCLAAVEMPACVAQFHPEGFLAWVAAQP